MMMPSNVYVGAPACDHARAVTTPWREKRGVAPRLSRTDEPVPKVTFAPPAAKQRWAKSEACESPITPQIGNGAASAPSSVVSPNPSEQSRTSGSARGGTSHHAQSSSSQARRVRSKSNVRLALVESVAKTAPRVSRWMR